MTKPGASTTRCSTCSHAKFDHGNRRDTGGRRSAYCHVKGCICPGFISATKVGGARRPRRQPVDHGTQTALFDLPDAG